jgi:hypothetical protein
MHFYDSKFCAKDYTKLAYDRSKTQGKTLVYVFKCKRCSREYITDYDGYIDLRYGSDEDDE